MGFLKKYFIAYAVLVLGMVLFLRWYKEKNFSGKILEEMLYTQSRFKGRTDDPCFFSIVGQPETPGEYLKLTIKCKDKETLFVLDYPAIREKTIKGVLSELFRINGVTLGPEKLTCKHGVRYLQMADPVAKQDNIECSL